ncbi:hypothetical protein [Tsukamurella soli]|uniref:Uncharacterized protein n=1 Tax=Tsukamurella soli TaxID=644556 RepID=A0ABP8JBB5_9ACTN
MREVDIVGDEAHTARVPGAPDRRRQDGEAHGGHERVRGDRARQAQGPTDVLLVDHAVQQSYSGSESTRERARACVRSG